MVIQCTAVLTILLTLNRSTDLIEDTSIRGIEIRWHPAATRATRHRQSLPRVGCALAYSTSMRLLRGSSLVAVWLLLLLCGCHPVGTHASKRSRTQSKRAAPSGLSETEAAGCARVQFLLGATTCETFLAEVSPPTGPRRSMLAVLLILAGV